MKETRILTPLQPDEEYYREKSKELYSKIQDLMKHFYKHPEEKSFKEILDK